MTLEEELKHRIFDRPTREEVVLGAMRRYNESLATARKRIKQFAKQKGEADDVVLRRTVARLPEMIYDDERAASEGDAIAKQRAEDRIEALALLEPLVERVEQGMSFERVMAELPVPTRVSDYRKYVEALEKRGIIVAPKPGESAAHAIRRLAQYQVLLLEREHAIPAPLSQTLIKEPGISRAEAVDQIVEYYIQREEERRIITVRRGAGRQAVAQRTLDKIGRDMKRYKRENDERLREQALAAVSDLPQYTRLGLTRSAAVKHALGWEGKKGRTSITNGLLEETHLTPEKIFAAAFAVADPEKMYLTGMYHGVERSRQHILVFDNIEAAARIIVYAREMKRNGVQQLSLFDVSKFYANTIEGKVLSRSGIREAYDTHIVSVPVFSSADNVAWRTPFETETHCSCKDARYMADLHAKAQYAFIYSDSHAVALAFYAMLFAVRDNGFVLNPFPLPTEAQQEVSMMVDGQVLIRSRMDGNVYTPNKAEREVLKMRNAQEVGYQRAYTHDVVQGLETIRTALLR
jgi:hypothetical protein